MKKKYITPATFEESLSVAQVIAASSVDDTPQIQDDPSEGGEGLVNSLNDWGDLW